MYQNNCKDMFNLSKTDMVCNQKHNDTTITLLQPGKLLQKHIIIIEENI